MEQFKLDIPFSHYPLQQAFESLTAHILLNGFPHLEAWCFTTRGDPYWRLYWNRQDGARIKHNEEEITFGPESILLIPPGTSFSADLTGPVDHFYMHFVLAASLTPSRSHIWKLAAGEFRRSLLGNIIDLGMQKGHINRIGQIQAYELIFDILRDMPAGSWTDHDIDSRIRKVLALIDRPEDLACLDNAVMAEAVHMSTAGFVRFFTSRMGISPMKYVIDRRLDRTGILLSHTDKSIDEIAEECGFCDRAHLSKLFKRRFGVGPAHYRKRGRAPA